MLAVGFIANLLVRAVDSRFHEPEDVVKAHLDELNGRSEIEQVGDKSLPGAGRLVFSWLIVSGILAYGVILTAITAARLFIH